MPSTLPVTRRGSRRRCTEMGVSYLALVEYNNQPPTLRFFTNKRAQKESPKTWAQANDWIASQLREHGTSNVRCTLSRVEFCIIG